MSVCPRRTRRQHVSIPYDSKQLEPSGHFQPQAELLLDHAKQVRLGGIWVRSSLGTLPPIRVSSGVHGKSKSNVPVRSRFGRSPEIFRYDWVLTTTLQFQKY